MENAVTNPPEVKSWRRLAFVLAAFILLPLQPSHLQIFVPIIETTMLLVPIIAVCAIVGWLAGGKPWLAVVWVLLAVWMLVGPAGTPGTPYDGMARGWALLLAGSFGLISLWSSTTPFLVRALGALGLAMGAAFALAISSPGGLDRYEKISASEFSGRGAAVVAALQESAQTPTFRAYAARVRGLDDVVEMEEAKAKAWPALSSVLLPSLLALESLACLALGWAIYTRLTPNRIGPALAPLKEFRFSDQLVWGVAVGGTLLLLPPFEEGRNSGLNLLVFFGALYFIRGLGVVSWMSKRRALLVTMAIVFFLVLPLFKLLVAGVVGVGLGDTWLDWRNKATVA